MSVLQYYFRKLYPTIKLSTPFDGCLFAKIKDPIPQDLPLSPGSQSMPHFQEALLRLIDKLDQAALHDDFEGVDDSPEGDFTCKLKDFNAKRENILLSMVRFKGKYPTAASGKKWLEDEEGYNKILLNEFCDSLKEIYNLRTTSAKVKSILWEIVEALAAASLITGNILVIVGGAFPPSVVALGFFALAGLTISAERKFGSAKYQIVRGIERDVGQPYNGDKSSFTTNTP